MAFRELVETIDAPAGATPRYKTLHALDCILDGTIFDGLEFPFSTEKAGTKYIPMAERRPDLPFNVARIVVDQTSGMLFGGEQMPLVKCESNADTKSVEELVTTLELDAVMMEAYEVGSSGSVGIVVRSDRYQQPYFKIVHGKYGKPIWDELAPTHMIAFADTRPIKAKELREQGYKLDDEIGDSRDYWIRYVISENEELRFEPLPAEDYACLGAKRPDGTIIAWVLRESFPHYFGTVPVIWGKNLIYGVGDDGRATYEFIKDIQIRIAQLLSQVARGYTYSADPLLARKRGEMDAETRIINPLADEDSWELFGPSGEVVRSSSNVLDLGRDGDAKLLEITGQGLAAAVEFIKMLREWSLELVGAMKSDSANTKGVSSGRALEMLYQSMQLLLKRQRIAYGTRVFIPLIKLLMLGIERGAIVVDDVAPVQSKKRMKLKWPQWMTPRGADLAQSASAWETLAGGSAKEPVTILPPKVVAEIAANELGLPDPAAIANEVTQINDEKQAQRDAELAASQTEQKPSE